MSDEPRQLEDEMFDGICDVCHCRECDSEFDNHELARPCPSCAELRGEVERLKTDYALLSDDVKNYLIDVDTLRAEVERLRDALHNIANDDAWNLDARYEAKRALDPEAP